jgi:hypothetical protein
MQKKWQSRSYRGDEGVVNDAMPPANLSYPPGESRAIESKILISTVRQKNLLDEIIRLDR